MKKILCVIFMLAVSIALGVTAFADSEAEEPTRASNYFSGYDIELSTGSGHTINIEVTVEGTHTMNMIGVYSIYVQEYNAALGRWQSYYLFESVGNYGYYNYNASYYDNTFYVTGTAGKQYRATLTCYAGDNNGGDIRELTSNNCYCF